MVDRGLEVSAVRSGLGSSVSSSCVSTMATDRPKTGERMATRRKAPASHLLGNVVNLTASASSWACLSCCKTGSRSHCATAPEIRRSLVKVAARWVTGATPLPEIWPRAPTPARDRIDDSLALPRHLSIPDVSLRRQVIKEARRPPEEIVVAVCKSLRDCRFRQASTKSGIRQCLGARARIVRRQGCTAAQGKGQEYPHDTWRQGHRTAPPTRVALHRLEPRLSPPLQTATSAEYSGRTSAL